MSSARLASYYLIVQGLAGLIWWILLLFAQPVRDLFIPTADGWLSARTLLVADVLMFGVLSIVAGLLALQASRFAAPVGWITVGATAYATLVAAGWLVEPVGHWLGFVCMTPTLIGTIASVWALHGSNLETRA